MVSLIIPVYNMAHYLRRSLTSVMAQTYSDIELIVVDDCSTDNTAHITEELRRSLPSCAYIHNPTNIGCLKSRYVGVDNAKGDYIAFLDADDSMDNRALERMVEAMQQYNVDLVQMRYQRIMKGLPIKYQEHWDRTLAGRRIDGEEFRSLASFVGMTSYIYPSCWGKLYRADLLKEASRIEFNQFWGEDQIFNIQYLRECRSMAFLDFVGYNYRWGGETTRAYRYSALRDYKHVYDFKRMMGQNEECLNAEIISLLRYHIRSLISETGFTPEAARMVIREELTDPLWQKAGLTADADQLVAEAVSDIQRNPAKYIAKRLLR